MSITLRWDNSEKTIIRLDFDGRWTADQFDHAFETVAMLTGNLPQTVYALGIVHNMLDASSVPTLNITVEAWPPNLKCAIFVGESSQFKLALSAARAMQDSSGLPKIVFVDTLEDAYEYITCLHLEEEYGQSNC